MKYNSYHNKTKTLVQLDLQSNEKVNILIIFFITLMRFILQYFTRFNLYIEKV